MNKVTLHGVEYNLPCYVVSLGLDMQCHHCITDGTILSVNSEKFVIRSEGIEIQLPISYLDDFYVDTKENRDKLEAQCRKEYIEWEEAVRKQLETCSRKIRT